MKRSTLIELGLFILLGLSFAFYGFIARVREQFDRDYVRLLEGSAAHSTPESWVTWTDTLTYLGSFQIICLHYGFCWAFIIFGFLKYNEQPND